MDNKTKEIIDFTFDIHKAASFGLEMSATLAEDLAEMGYRKVSNVVEEIFKDFDKIMREHKEGFCCDWYMYKKYAELKKKYKEDTE